MYVHRCNLEKKVVEILAARGQIAEYEARLTEAEQQRADFQRRQIEKHPDIAPKDLPQVFAVDVPRIVQLARAMAEGRDDPQHAFEVALFAGLAFQFATASYLTDGSLRTFVVHEPEEEVLAEAA